MGAGACLSCTPPDPDTKNWVDVFTAVANSKKVLNSLMDRVFCDSRSMLFDDTRFCLVKALFYRRVLTRKYLKGSFVALFFHFIRGRVRKVRPGKIKQSCYFNPGGPVAGRKEEEGAVLPGELP